MVHVKEECIVQASLWQSTMHFVIFLTDVDACLLKLVGIQVQTNSSYKSKNIFVFTDSMQF